MTFDYERIANEFYLMSTVDGDRSVFGERSSTFDIEVLGMDSAQYGYLRLNKYLLFIMGIWPYQTVQHRSFASLIFIPVIVAQLILQVSNIVVKQANVMGYFEMNVKRWEKKEHLIFLTCRLLLFIRTFFK